MDYINERIVPVFTGIPSTKGHVNLLASLNGRLKKHLHYAYAIV